MISRRAENLLAALQKMRAEGKVITGIGLQDLIRQLEPIVEGIQELERCAVRDDVRDKHALPDGVTSLDQYRRGMPGKGAGK